MPRKLFCLFSIGFRASPAGRWTNHNFGMDRLDPI